MRRWVPGNGWFAFWTKDTIAEVVRRKGVFWQPIRNVEIPNPFIPGSAVRRADEASVGFTFFASLSLGLVTLGAWWIVYVEVAALFVHRESPRGHVPCLFFRSMAEGEFPTLIHKILKELGR